MAGRAKSMAGKPPAATSPAAEPEPPLEAAVLPAVAAPPEEPKAPDGVVIHARGIESIIRQRIGNPVSMAVAPVAAPREPSAAEVRAGFRSFEARVVDAKVGDVNYVPPEERNNPDYREAAERKRKEQESENMKKARAAFGLDANVKVVFPSQNMGRQAVPHKW